MAALRHPPESQASSGADREGVPEAVAPPPHNPRFPLVDGLRAVAVLSVLLVHISVPAGIAWGPAERLLSHLNIGVTIFFLISGFLLYRPFIVHRIGGVAASSTASYLKRRALRILPAYWLAVTVITLLPSGMGVGGWDLASQFALLQTLPFAGEDGCATQILTCGYSQTWSLAIEAGFYAVLPLYVLAADRLARGRDPQGWMRLELRGLALLALVSILIRFVLFPPDLTSPWQGTFIGYGLWFGLGMALAVASVASEGGARMPRPLAAIGARANLSWLAAVALYVLVAALLPANPFLSAPIDLVGEHVAFGAIALLLLAPVVLTTGPAGLPGRVLAHPLVAWLGLISYGIFLWHLAVVYELTRAGVDSFLPLLGLTLVISVALASASYYGLERPVLKLKNHRLLGRAGRSEGDGPSEGPRTPGTLPSAPT